MKDASEESLAVVRNLCAKPEPLCLHEERLLSHWLGMDGPISTELERWAVVSEIERLDAVGEPSDRLEALCALEIAWWRKARGPSVVLEA